MDEYLDSDYGQILKKADDITQEYEETAQPASVISNLIYKILNTKFPKTNYIVSKNIFQTWVLVKFLPARVVDRILWRMLCRSD